MAPKTTPVRKLAHNADTREAEAFLRDLAFVLKMTESVKESIAGEAKSVNRIAAIVQPSGTAAVGV